ncbi:hypothetical protein AYK26_03015 [Euryarchaeota archaeon SM23-78]|nr:MAG: hypothetical protein AYK26_03015 [Euryarchaeota archaeon SM23-78]MBW3000415.1 aminotransferase class I/II-fold pyridoxal phosphate-dependent enzyme [Candidatus Woesearchaeota archaeon]
MRIIHAGRDEFNFTHPKKVLEVIKEVNSESLRYYSEEQPLINALAKKHGVDKDRIFLESGAIGVIHRVFDNVLTPQKSILLSNPGYPYFHQLAKHHKAEINAYPIKETKNCFKHDYEAILKGLKQKPVIAVITDPESPLGCSVSSKKLEEILKETSTDTLIFLDQVHEGFRKENVKDIGELVNRYPNLLVVRSFSKLYGLASLRVGYAMCGEKIKEMINYHEKYLGFCDLAQRIAIAALESEEYYKAKVEIINKEKKRFSRIINELPGYRAYKTDHMSLVIRAPEKQIPYLKHHAKASNIQIGNLEKYHKILGENSLKGLIRITIGPKKDNDYVLDMIKSVAWLFNFKIINAEQRNKINTRETGYTINRQNFYFNKSNLPMGYYKVIIPPRHEVPEHKHEEQDEYFHFLTSARFKLNDEWLDIKPDTVVNVYPSQKHTIQACPDKFVRYLCSRFPYKHEDKVTSKGERVIHKE